MVLRDIKGTNPNMEERDEITCLNEYQNLASRTAKFSPGKVNGLTYTALGLNGEAGEYAEVIKKMLRDNEGKLNPEIQQKALLELGDTLWYLSQAARIAGFTLQQVAEANIRKLESRRERGKIHGEGDNR